MMNVMQKTIPLYGCPALWCLKIQATDDIASPSGDADAADRLKFDDLSEHPSLTAALPGNVDVDYIEIDVADTSKIKFPATQRHMSGVDTEDDETTPLDITPTSEQSSGYAKLVVSINEADRDSVGWGAFVEKLQDDADAYWLIVAPMPFSYYGRNTTKNAEGFFYFTGKISESPEYKERPLSITFESVVCPHASSAGWSAAVTGLDFTDDPTDEEPGYIPLKGIPTFHITPEALTGDDADLLMDGKLVTKKITHS
jgi:hypothetical protein